MVAGGVSSLWWADGAVRGVGALLRPATGLLPSGVREALPAPTSGWRIYAVDPPFPRFDPQRWRLQVDGMVERPLSLSYGDLSALPRVRQRSDFHCVTGWSVRGVDWAGVRVSDLVRAAGPLPGARAITFASLETPYTDSLSLRDAFRADVLIADRMDGRPLTRAHGAPARLVIPAMYGYKNVKWLSRLTLTTDQQTGYWEQRGYDRAAWVGASNGRGG